MKQPAACIMARLEIDLTGHEGVVVVEGSP
jgi:hypothetical protein